MPAWLRTSKAFARLLKFIGHLDEEIAADIAAGFRITGGMRHSHVYRARFPEEVSEVESVEWLQLQAKAVRQAVFDSAGTRMHDKDIEDAIRKITVEAVDAGWADRPFAAGQLHEKWIAILRFSVRQGQKWDQHLQKFVAKIRPMDDLSEMGFERRGQRCSFFAPRIKVLGGIVDLSEASTRDIFGCRTHPRDDNRLWGRSQMSCATGP